ANPTHADGWVPPWGPARPPAIHRPVFSSRSGAQVDLPSGLHPRMEARVPAPASSALRVLILLAATAGALAGAQPPVRPAPGHFHGHGDVGRPATRGDARYNGVTEEYTLTAGGTNVWDRRDEFHFVWRRLTGDFILHTRVAFHGDGAD